MELFKFLSESHELYAVFYPLLLLTLIPVLLHVFKPGADIRTAPKLRFDANKQTIRFKS